MNQKNNQYKKIRKTILFILFILILSVIALYISKSLKFLLIDLLPNWTNEMYQNYMQIIAFIIFIIASFVILFEFYNIKEKQYQNKISSLEKEIHNKINSIENLNDRLNENKLYDIKNNIWDKNVINEYLEQIIEKNIKPFSLIKLKCNGIASKKSFLSRCNFLLDEKIILVNLSDYEYLLIFLYYDYYDTFKELDYIITNGTTITNKLFIDKMHYSKEQIINLLELN